MRQPTQIPVNPASPGAKATLFGLMTHMGLPGVVVADGNVVTASVAGLNEWFARFHTGSSLSTGSRAEVRNGQLFNVGGLDWSLSIPLVPGVGRVVVRTVSVEREPLPDLPVVRAGYPYGLNVMTVRGVAA